MAVSRTDILACALEDHARLRYVFQRILGPRLGLHVRFTSNPEEIRAWEGPCIAYGFQPNRTCFHLPASSCEALYTNKGIIPEVSDQDETPCIFPVSTIGPIRFDLPAAIFWMLARVEEYSSTPLDRHGRFSGKQSLAHRAGFLEIPVVDRWIDMLARGLKRMYPSITLPVWKASFRPTYDIDFAWRYLHKPFSSQCRSLARDLFQEGPKTFLQGCRVIMGREADPYDLYGQWESVNAILFFPLGDKSPMDRNHSASDPSYGQLVRRWHENGLCGLHPSYLSPEDPIRLEQEVDRYTRICGSPPIRSRQHYLRLHIPKTLRQLEKLGICEEWSMGFADLPGFRAGTAHPYPWYDMEEERSTDLVIHPFQVMDATLRHYLHVTPDEGEYRLKRLWHTIQQTGGEFITLWHNNSIACVDHDWRGWEALPNCLGRH